MKAKSLGRNPFWKWKFFRFFKPAHKENRMKHEGDLLYARENYYKKRPSNLRFLLEGRYGWMNAYISGKYKVLEVGCGTGVSRDFIRKNCKLILSDFTDYPWVDKKNVDALNTSFKNGSFDVVFCSNMIHHIPYPKIFFKEMARILRPGGKLLIQEINCSFFMGLILRVMRHEGFDFNARVFQGDFPATDKNDLWSANCAIPNLLFDNEENFLKNTPYFKILDRGFSEFLTFPLSGGVIAKKKVINLSYKTLKKIKKFENLLIKLSPRIFAMQRKIVLQKN